MKVILKNEVDNVGLAGDVVEVADGYGRNYLLPRGMAILATPGAMKEAEALTRARKVVEAKTLGAAESMRETLESRVLRVTARVDERGALYGSVSAGDIQRVLKERGHEVPRKRIDLKGTIKQIGTYEIPVRVHPQVTATVSVEVVDVEGKVGVDGPVVDEADEAEALAEQAIEAAEAYEAEQRAAEEAAAAADESSATPDAEAVAEDAVAEEATPGDATDDTTTS